MAKLTAGGLLTIVRDECVNELGDLAADDASQNAAIYRFLNVVLRKRARQAFLISFSDTLTIAADGYQTFLRSGIDIVNELYEPQALYPEPFISTSYAATKRTSWDMFNGWIHEDPYSQIHTRGISGSFKLKYLRYPANVAADGDEVEFPPAGYWDLIYDVAGMVKLVKNFYDEAAAVRGLATGTAAVKAATAAKGTNSAPPSPLDREV